MCAWFAQGVCVGTGECLIYTTDGTFTSSDCSATHSRSGQVPAIPAFLRLQALISFRISTQHFCSDDGVVNLGAGHVGVALNNHTVNSGTLTSHGLSLLGLGDGSTGAGLGTSGGGLIGFCLTG